MKNKYLVRFLEFLPYFVLAVLILLVLDKSNPYLVFPSRDRGSFLYVGRLLLQGGHLYITAWDSKPPGIYYVNALGLWLGRNTAWGLWLLEFIFLYGSAVIGYRLLRKVWRPGAAVFGIVFWTAGVSLVYAKGDAVEEYSLLFNMAILLLYWWGIRRPKANIFDFLIGAMTGLSFLFRANNIGAGMAVGICWLILAGINKDIRGLLKRVGAMLLGVGTIMLCVGVYLRRQGILVEAWNAAIIYNVFYVGNRTRILLGILSGFRYLGIVAWVGLTGYGASISYLVRRIRNIKAIDPFMIFLIVSWPIEILLSSLSGRGYIHYYFNWLPAIALLCGYAYEALSTGLFLPRVLAFLDKENALLAIVALIALVFNYRSVVDYARSFNVLLFHRAEGIEAISPVAQYIRHNTEPSDEVLDWVQTGINYMSDRDSPTPYIWYPAYYPSPVTSGLEEGFLQDFTGKPPEVIVDAYLTAPDDILSLNQDIRYGQLQMGKGLLIGKASNVDRVFAFIQSHYDVETVIDGDTIYRLKHP